MQREHLRKKAVMYTRVSSQEQAREGYSLEAQQALLERYAQREGIEIVHHYQEAESAKQTGRDAFSEMVEFLTRESKKKSDNRCRILLVEKTDRLYRNLFDNWKLDPDRLGIEIHFVKENVIFSENSGSDPKFMHGLRVLMAKKYIDNLSEETAKGMIGKASQGMWPTVAPYGYRNVVTEDGRKVIIPDDDRAEAVRRLFEAYASGDCSIRDIAKRAHEFGLVSGKSGAKLSKSRTNELLHNKTYTGKFDWKGQEYEGTYTPIISEELWEKVQNQLHGRNVGKLRISRKDFAFSRLITCGHCGCAVVAELKKGKYIYYHCSGYRGKCPEPYVREEVLEAEFSKILKQLHFDQEVIGWVAEALKQSHASEKRFHDLSVRKLRDQHNQLQERLDRMYIDKLDGRISDTDFDRLAGSWRKEQDEIDAAIGALQSSNRLYIEDGVMLMKLARQASELFERQSAKEKGKLLNFLLSNCYWKDGALTYDFKQPFDMIAKVNSHPEPQADSHDAETSKMEKWLRRQDSNLRQRD